MGRDAIAYEKQLHGVASNVLASYGFEGDMAISIPVCELSGGQKACLRLAILSLTPAHILILDEPTNHLDAEACEALSTGLVKFSGAVLVVTHDDSLIHRLVQNSWQDSALLVCQNGHVKHVASSGSDCMNALKARSRLIDHGDKRDAAECQLHEGPPDSVQRVVPTDVAAAG